MRIPNKTLTIRKKKRSTFGGKDDLESMAVAAQVFNLLREGHSSYEVAIQLNMSTKSVKAMMTACMAEFTEDIQDGVEQARKLDIARTNAIIKQFTPIAMSTKVEVSRLNGKGEPYTDDEYKYCLEAGKLVLSAIETRAKLFGYAKAEVTQNNITNNHAFFLAKESEFIGELVDAQPIEIINRPTKELDAIESDPLDIDLVHFDP